MTEWRVLILADTHGFLDPRIAELATDCHWAVHAGDVGEASIIVQLQRKGPQVLAVRGNNDVPAKWPDEDQNVLEQLPWTDSLSLPGGELIIEHGHRVNPAAQRHRRLRSKYPEAKAVVYGHSHHQVCDQDEDPWILNPGAAGRARTYGGGPACLLLTVNNQRWRIQAQRFEPLKRSAYVAAG